jgi:hypothetical protein
MAEYSDMSAEAYTSCAGMSLKEAQAVSAAAPGNESCYRPGHNAIQLHIQKLEVRA